MSKIRNYDIDLLTFWIDEDPGFILGEGVLGTNILGTDSTTSQIDANFYNMNIDSPVTVDGVFVYREVRRLNLTARVVTPINYDGKRITVKYDDIELFKGTVREYSIDEVWTESTNTPSGLRNREYTVTITAMSGEERFANTPTPATIFNGLGDEDVTTRVHRYLGLQYGEYSSADSTDINLGIDDIGETAVLGQMVGLADSMPNLLETLRNILRLQSYNYVYEPWDSNIMFITNSRWLGGSVFDALTQATALTFTDDPDDIVLSGGDDFVHDNNVVGYANRSMGKNSNYFVKGVTITMMNNLDVETTYGPYRATSAFPQDININIGRQINAGAALANKIASIMPLRSREQQFTSSIKTKLQSRKQLGIYGEGPGMAVIKSQGVTSRVAVLTVTHRITRDQWDVEYVCGPEHLISRESDRQPFIVTDLVANETTPGSILFEWTTPNLHYNGTLYAIIYDDSADGTGPGGVGPVERYRGLAKAPGVLESMTIPGFSEGFYYTRVYYTNNPTPNNTSPSYVYSPTSRHAPVLIL